MNNDGALKETLHWSNSDLEVHKVVVGPYENNVFVLRCKATGEGVLIDAANEHALLLELCEQLGVKRVLETHGHWDHIQAIPAMREAGYEVAVTRADAPRLVDVGYDVFLDDKEVVEIGRMRLHTIHNPGHTEGSISFQVAKTLCFLVAPAMRLLKAATSPPSFSQLNKNSLYFPTTPLCCLATVQTPPLEPSVHTYKNGLIEDGRRISCRNC